MQGCRRYYMQWTLLWNARFDSKFELVSSLSTKLEVDQHKISWKHNLPVRKSPKKLWLSAYAKKKFLHIITQVNKLILPPNCCVRLLTFNQNVRNLRSNNASSTSRSFLVFGKILFISAKYHFINYMMFYVCRCKMCCCVTLSVYPHPASWKICLTTVGIESAIFGLLLFPTKKRV
jgi:hypothetical protein